MNDSQKFDFYMNMCFILLNKFCNNEINITEEEWLQYYGRKSIKHRFTEDSILQVRAVIELNS